MRLLPNSPLCLWGLLSCALAATLTAKDDLPDKPVLLYSRYFNAAGESRYLPEGTYQEVLGKLRKEFTVRIHNQPLNRQSLRGIHLVVIANPSDKAVGTNLPPPHFSASNIPELVSFVEGGGGLIIMGNQENHNLDIEDTNKLLRKFGLEFTNLYTDAKSLALPEETPIIGGLRWAYYTGNLVNVLPNHAARPRALVKNDQAKPLGGERNQAGTLLGIAEPGKGRVAVITDAGWITDSALDGRGIGPVSIKEQDNWEIFRRLARWAAHAE